MGMRWRRSARAWGVALAAAATVVGTATLGITSAANAVAAPAQSTTAGPTIKLIVAQNQIEVGKYGKGPIYFDPGVWVASMNAAFQLNVSRSSYTKPITITEVMKTPGGTVYRPLPSWVPKSWNGLKHFLTLVIRNSRGKVVVTNQVPFCPDGYEISKATTNSALSSPFPGECNSFDPFPLGEVWGIARGWAVDPATYVPWRLNVGTYHLTETINPGYSHLFGISRRDGTATVTVHVVKQTSCCGGPLAARVPAGFVKVPTRKNTAASAAHSLASLPADVPVLHSVPADALPDLIPLPSWGISIGNSKKTSFLDFGATVWIAGNSPLDVEGYRNNGSPTMQAWQYFWRNGKLIGRIRVGTMGFSNYNSWHFQQFAQYKLLNAKKKVVISSRKISFCIAPTDNVDLVLRHATWVPSYTGIAGNCGSSTALWVQEELPIGWGDTYFQSVPYQNFNISKLPNGVYYIEIIANPEHLLHEVSTKNDVSIREIIISGTPGHRHVRVPAWHGMDPENGSGYFGL